MDADKAKYTLPDGSTLDVSETNMSRSIVSSIFLEYNKIFQQCLFFVCSLASRDFGRQNYYLDLIL